MRTAPLALASLLFLALPLPVDGQRGPANPRSTIGVTLGAMQPTGAFGDSVGTGFAMDMNYLYRVDPGGVLGIRLEGGFSIYGSEDRRVLLSPTVGGRITTELVTSNNIAHLVVGPQLMVPGRTVRPYLNAQAGIAYFSTTSSLRDDYGESFASTNNFDDWAPTYGGGAGIYVPLNRRGRTPVALDLGLRYRHTGPVSYLREGSIRDLPDGRIAFEPIRSDTDLFQVGIGVAVGLVPDDERDRPRSRDRDRRRRPRW